MGMSTAAITKVHRCRFKTNFIQVHVNAFMLTCTKSSILHYVVISKHKYHQQRHAAAPGHPEVMFGGILQYFCINDHGMQDRGWCKGLNNHV